MKVMSKLYVQSGIESIILYIVLKFQPIIIWQISIITYNQSKILSD